MKSSIIYLTLSVLSICLYAENATENIVLLSDSEAEAIIASREVAKEVRHQNSLRELEGADIVNTKLIQTPKGTLQINAVKPLILEKPTPKDPANSEIQFSEEQWAAMMAEQQARIPEQISMGANVYGDEYSEITWRDRETNSEFQVWTNVSLNYLRPITSVEDSEYDYMYFGFVTNYTREGEANRIQFAEEQGYVGLESRWKTPPVEFSPDQFEYVVIADASTEVPEKLYRQLSAVFGYYISNREELETEHHNSVTLEKARLKYLEENPPAPKKTMINFWKIESESTEN